MPPASNAIRAILIRHGQTVANRDHFLQGASDDPMTEIGYEQAAQIGAFLAEAHIDHVMSSDLIRAVETAKPIADAHGLAVETRALLREWNCGDWDGKPAVDFLSMMAEKGLCISDLSPNGGEKLSDVRERACQAVEEIKAMYAGKSIVVCSHGDFMRMMLSCMLGIGIDQANSLRFENASYSIVEWDGAVWNLMAMSCLPILCK